MSGVPNLGQREIFRLFVWRDMEGKKRLMIVLMNLKVPCN